MKLTPMLSLATVAALVLLTGCRSLGSSCHEPKPYENARNLPPLQVPAGLESPDTRNALQIPVLNQPEPPRRSAGDPCLDEPPEYKVEAPPQPLA